MPNQKETKYEKVKFVSAEDLGNKLDTTHRERFLCRDGFNP